MHGIFTLPIKGEYHDNFLTAQAVARGILDRECQQCLFDRLDWFENLHRIALRENAPLLLRASNEGQEIWLPLMQTGFRQYGALANWYNFTWRPIFAGRYDEVTKLALLREVAMKARDHAISLSLAPLPDEDGSASLTATAFEQAGWTVFREISDENHYLDVAGRSFDQYWQGRPSRLKNTVKRKAKADIVHIRIETEFSEASWQDYERVYAKSWKPSEGTPEFLKSIAQQEGLAGTLRLGLAYIDGQPVAAQFWTCENGTALIHKLAHDEDYIQASAGTLLSAALFQYAIDVDRVDHIDFGTGNDAYKSEWMDAVRPRYKLHIYWPNHMANWPKIAYRAIKAKVKNDRD